ncbi:MAG: hypothetical protein P8M17_02975 [Saprospiraceae bacterium]|nr:hypothetical protein [Saprospiraceae bacterium]MDG1435029.1 hypothetical protein [Saprospiraceae bacterium]MDG2417929.1 hypothetical protein [Saprospiraceae bacterium]
MSKFNNVKPNSPLFSNVQKVITKQDGKPTVPFLGDILLQKGISKTSNRKKYQEGVRYSWSSIFC